MDQTPEKVSDYHKTLCKWHERYLAWLMDKALPLWGTQGVDKARGGFHELMGLDGAPVLAPRRARVQGRQSYAFAQAGAMGWKGPWEDIAEVGLQYLNAHYRRPSGLYCTLASQDGAVLDETEKLYDQAFALVASATLYKVQPQRADLKDYALDLLKGIEARRHPAGGFRENGDVPFLSNPHMHLFEAALAWYEASEDQVWFELASEIARLCLTRFIDPDTLTLHEYFDEKWAILGGDMGHSVEPGHQFEWTWLLERWSKISGKMDAHQMARRLFEVGASGTDKVRNVTWDEMDDTFVPRRQTGRLWPQTERLKAALILADAEGVTERDYYYGEAILAAECLWKYLETPVPGLWRDKLQPDDSFTEEAAPASSLYHIICAIDWFGKCI